MPTAQPPTGKPEEQEKLEKAISPEEAQIIRDVVRSRKGLHEKLAKQ